ncbi:hypothetical protein RSAG8_05859, partial [Rhizoctonia solani AG-8 WAC10335]
MGASDGYRDINLTCVRPVPVSLFLGSFGLSISPLSLRSWAGNTWQSQFVFSDPLTLRNGFCRSGK